MLNQIRVLDAPPTVVPVTKPGVEIDRSAVIRDAFKDAVSIDTVAVAFSDSERMHFPEASPAP